MRAPGLGQQRPHLASDVSNLLLDTSPIRGLGHEENCRSVKGRGASFSPAGVEEKNQSQRFLWLPADAENSLPMPSWPPGMHGIQKKPVGGFNEQLSHYFFPS